MNDNARAWVAALRSRKFKQGAHHLHRKFRGEDEYCCLGVACHLAVEAGVCQAKEVCPEAPVPLVAYDNDTSVLPQSVADWLGLSQRDGTFKRDGDLTTRSKGTLGEDTDLTILNDSGRSFEFIASVIESEPPGLFR